MAASTSASSIPAGRQERVELLIDRQDVLHECESESRWVGPQWATRIQLATSFDDLNGDLNVTVWLNDSFSFTDFFPEWPLGGRCFDDKTKVHFELVVANNQDSACLKKKGTFFEAGRFHGQYMYAEWNTGLSSQDILEDDGWINDAGELRVQATLTFPSVREPQRKTDYTQKMAQVTFLLSESPPLFFDKRILVAQSEYFAEMLSNDSWIEGRTHEVDLRNNPDANQQTVHAVLNFLQHGDFQAQGDETYAMSVRRLADQYRLEELIKRVDDELTHLLSEGNVLTLLRQVVGTGGVLEKRCMAMLRADDWALLEQQKEKLFQLSKEDGALSARMVELFVEATGSWRAAKRARTASSDSGWWYNDWTYP
ncbi:HMT1 [Symbiodinium necroappetens]|uniref:HMT1 protein n=1 Tax=Symbiodinium necroappetens TaxID=1628268 RepID=A0A812M614_9DINO|nr:HMT1 [Symbiodinium necroappetens]